MSDRPAAPPADAVVADGPAQPSGAQVSETQASEAQPSGPGQRTAGRGRAWLALALRLLSSKPVRWGFVAVAVALGAYVVADEWTQVRAGLASLGFLAIAGALVAVLLGLVATMQVWRVLLAALGSPLGPARRPGSFSSASSVSTCPARSGRSWRRWSWVPRTRCRGTARPAPRC